MAVVIENITARVVTPDKGDSKTQSGGSEPSLSPVALARAMEEKLSLQKERIARICAD